jgi:hypothetical protein
MKKFLMIATLLLVATGCVEAELEETNTNPLVCEEVGQHLSECFGQSMPIDPHCDVATAEQVLEQSCAQIQASGKADWFGDWLCRLGFLYRCEAPVCEDVPGPEEVSSCSDYIGMDGCASCEYYFCRDRNRSEPCGARGYYQGFVGRYCILFTEATIPRLSPQGQQWIADVRPCLQEAMEEVDDEMSCEDVKAHGYNAHLGCYVNTGFCALPLTDMITIFNTVSPLDLGTQPFTTGFQCIRRWFNPNTGSLTDEGWDRAQEERSQSTANL